MYCRTIRCNYGRSTCAVYSTYLRRIYPRMGISATNRVNVFNTTCDIQDKKSTGRPRKTSHKEDKEIEKMVLNYKEANTQKITRELTSLGTNISSRTVNRRLAERGFKYSYPTQKPALTKKQKSLRLSFAKQNRSRNWNNVIVAYYKSSYHPMISNFIG